MKMERQVYEAMGHFSKGFQVLTDAFRAAGMSSSDGPEVTTQDPVTASRSTTSKAKKDADKRAPKTNTPTNPEENNPITTEEPVNDEPVEQPAPATKTKEAAAPAKKASKGKPEEPGFETLDREQKIEHLRSRMVQVSVKLAGDREKVYGFLKKYKATKVHELSDENLDNLKNDIEVFLSGPDALDI